MSRFVVQTVGGWLVAGSGGNPTPHLSAHVCDSVRLYEVVATYRSEVGRLGKDGALRRAHETAERLNRDAA